eukprot:11215318-Lingulodinium_polyedra.AAC.1
MLKSPMRKTHFSLMLRVNTLRQTALTTSGCLAYLVGAEVKVCTTDARLPTSQHNIGPRLRARVNACKFGH